MEAFAPDNGLAGRAAHVLWDQPLHVQRVVLGHGRLHGCQNASSALMTRLRRARQDCRD